MMEQGRKASKDALRIVVSMAVMLMLLWILHMGHELATKTWSEVEIHGSRDGYLAILFGVATVVFGVVYFIIGLTIVAELVLDLSAWLRGKDIAGTTRSQEKENARKEKMICQACIQFVATLVSMFMLGWAIYHGFKLAAGTQKGGIHNCLAFVIGFTTMAFGFIYFIIGISVVAESVLHLSGRLPQGEIVSDICEYRKDDPLLRV